MFKRHGTPLKQFLPILVCPLKIKPEWIQYFLKYENDKNNEKIARNTLKIDASFPLFASSKYISQRFLEIDRVLFAKQKKRCFLINCALSWIDLKKRVILPVVICMIFIIFYERIQL